MKCPYCESRIDDGSVTCPVCRASLASSPGASPISAGREELYRSDDELSLGAKLATWFGVMLFTLPAALVVFILYQSWKRDYPNKASQLNLHCWLAFFAGIALNVGCALAIGTRLLPSEDGGGVKVLAPQEQSRAQQFRDYVEVVRRKNEETPGAKVTADEQTRTIIIEHQVAGKWDERVKPELFKARLKEQAAKSAVFRQDRAQIRALGITIVYRVKTADGKAVDFPFAPTEWDGME